jgi:hypothetical protein
MWHSNTEFNFRTRSKKNYSRLQELTHAAWNNKDTSIRHINITQVEERDVRQPESATIVAPSSPSPAPPLPLHQTRCHFHISSHSSGSFLLLFVMCGGCLRTSRWVVLCSLLVACSEWSNEEQQTFNCTTTTPLTTWEETSTQHTNKMIL